MSNFFVEIEIGSTDHSKLLITNLMKFKKRERQKSLNIFFCLFQLTLHLLTSISKQHKSSMASIPSEILPQILVLLQSPLLQGGALHAMLEFFQAVVGLPKLGFRDLLQVQGQVGVTIFIQLEDIGTVELNPSQKRFLCCPFTKKA